MPPDRPLVAFRQELPHRPLWPLAHALGARGDAIAFLAAGGPDVADEARFAVLGWRRSRVFAWPAGRPGAIEGLRRFLGGRRMEPDPSSPVPYRGGFLGWISYDVGRHV